MNIKIVLEMNKYTLSVFSHMGIINPRMDDLYRDWLDVRENDDVDNNICRIIYPRGDSKKINIYEGGDIYNTLSEIEEGMIFDNPTIGIDLAHGPDMTSINGKTSRMGIVDEYDYDKERC